MADDALSHEAAVRVRDVCRGKQLVGVCACVGLVALRATSLGCTRYRPVFDCCEKNILAQVRAPRARGTTNLIGTASPVGHMAI